VSAHIGSLVNQEVSDMKQSRASLRFRKASYFPLLRDVRPTQTGEKVYLGGSRPLMLTASLDHEIYVVGQPILVTLGFLFFFFFFF